MSFLGDYSEVGLAAAVGLLVTLASTPLVAWAARRIGAVDDPTDDRRIHKAPTPRLGGVAVLLGVLTASALLLDWTSSAAVGAARIEQYAVLLAGAVAICLLGAADDILSLPWWAKLAGQVVIAVLVVIAPLALPATESATQLGLLVQRIDPPLLSPATMPIWLGVALAALWIVALMNMVNFIDGVDGLAAGTCAISAATFAIIAASYSRTNVAILAAAACGAAIGFLPHNFRRGGARIFLGDSGSMLLGYLLAVIAIQGVLKTAAAVSLVIPLALLAVPIFDTMFVVSKRLKYKLPVSNADRWHLHHRLLNVGFSPRRVTISFWLWTASMSLVALALRFVDYGNSRHWNTQGLLLVGIVALVMVGFSLYLATTLEIIKLRHVRERNARIAAERARAVTERTEDPA